MALAEIEPTKPDHRPVWDGITINHAKHLFSLSLSLSLSLSQRRGSAPLSTNLYPLSRRLDLSLRLSLSLDLISLGRSSLNLSLSLSLSLSIYDDDIEERPKKHYFSSILTCTRKTHFLHLFLFCELK